ncbi:MAG: NTP transferase domain-containing protein [Phycisphaerales bacterium]|nr:NTP transferase domain-containing protein [Phycisphaerales bacterium]
MTESSAHHPRSQAGPNGSEGGDWTGRPLAAVVLAAGKGTRMRSDLPKVLHEIAAEPMVRWVVRAVRELGARPIALVVGHGAELVRKALAGPGGAAPEDLAFAVQEPQLGTAHAVAQARPMLESLGDGDVFVLCGDGPLIRVETLRRLLEVHRKSGAAATLATAVIADPAGYGRVLRDADGRFRCIREQKDASPEELAVHEVNPSYYCFRVADLLAALERVDNRNAKGEYYITDVFEILLRDGRRVEVVDAVPPEDVLSINTPEQLAEVDAVMSRRLGRGPAPLVTGR